MTDSEDVKRAMADIKVALETTAERVEREAAEAKAKIQASEEYQSWKGNRYLQIGKYQLRWTSTTRFFAGAAVILLIAAGIGYWLK